MFAQSPNACGLNLFDDKQTEAQTLKDQHDVDLSKLTCVSSIWAGA